ncbi:hypothetical protein ON010_g12895 [Phytophthora cinnamomi]|nr:hypothetical protein ON010_g12895 [Phytophthora cinnamomi]
MPARRKRSGSSRASKRKKKHNKAASEVGNPPEKQVNAMESYRPTPRNQVWKIKLLGHPFNVAMNPMLPSMHPGFLPRFPTADHLAEWVFSAAKHRPVQLDLKLCERSEEVRDALLQKFSRWPETKIARAAEQFNALNQQAEQQCQEQVQLYVQELRGKLLGGMKALFWLDVLQPLKHPALLPRHEVREVLVALLEEIKTIDGLFELLIKTNERLWAVLTLPLKLEPLFQGSSTRYFPAERGAYFRWGCLSWLVSELLGPWTSPT